MRITRKVFLKKKQRKKKSDRLHKRDKSSDWVHKVLAKLRFTIISQDS